MATSPDDEHTVRRRMAPEERRAHLLDAAAVLLVREGFDALTMEAVAQEAGVSKSLGWAYFDNIGELVVALFDRELSVLYGRIADAMGEVEGFEDKVTAAVRAYFDVVEQRGAVLSAVQAAVQATSHGQTPRQERTEAFFVSLGELVRLGYEVEWPLAIAHGAAIAAVVNAWGQIWGFGGGALPRLQAEALCRAWVVGGLDANLAKKEI